MAPARDKWVRRFIIPETARHKKGFTIYKVTSVVFLKSSREEISKVSVWKRFNDFKKLYSELNVLYARSQIKEAFPPFPKSKFFGRFEAEVIEERREYALKFLNFIGKYSCLYSSDVFIKFFETTHVDTSVNECSQSIGSDTSEDDHHIVSTNVTSRNGLDISNTPQNSVKSSVSIVPNFVCIEETDSVLSQKVSGSNGLVSSSENRVEINTDSQKVKESITQEINTNNNVVKVDNTQHCNYNNNMIDRNVTKEKQSLENNLTTEATSVVIHDGSDLPQTQADTTQYILIAAAHMSAAFKHEAIAEFEEAFMQYKMGISSLLTGVQTDPDAIRAEVVKEKISKYLARAEKLYNRHLNCNISKLKKPISELQYYKVLKVMKSVMLVKDVRTNCPRIVKTVEKLSDYKDNICDYVLRGQIPYIVSLHACVETETTVFLILQYASRGKLWDHIMSEYKLETNLHSPTRRQSHLIADESNVKLDIQETSSRATKLVDEPCSNRIEKCLVTSKPNLSSEVQIEKCLEEENTESMMYNGDVPTTQLLEKAQKLLQSVNATLKKSNSIASRLNEKQLFYPNNVNILSVKNGSDLSEESNTVLSDMSKTSNELNAEPRSLLCRSNAASVDSLPLNSDEYIANQCNLNKYSTSNSCIDLSFCQNALSDDLCTRHNLDNKNDNFTCSDVLQRSSERYSITTNNRSIHNEHNSRLQDMSHSWFSENDADTECQELWRIPEGIIRLWAAEILLALEALHQQEVVVLDLKPDNILLDNSGHVLLTYIVPNSNPQLSKLKRPYSSPELCMFLPTIPITQSADIWSFGVILYELLTGIKFQSWHPGPFHSHSILSIPNRLSENAKSLLLNVLKYQPNERLTIPEIKQHPFFEEIDWLNLMNL